MNTLNGPKDAFIVDFCHRISHHDLRNHDSDRCNPSAPYPPIEDLVRSAKARYHNDSFPAYYNNNALFGFAIRAHFDQKERSITETRRYRALSRILAMGICDWDKEEKNGVAAKSFFPIRYAAVLGNKLFNVQLYEELRVSLSSVSRLLDSRN